jgi:small subunit ribosomal protein S16
VLKIRFQRRGSKNRPFFRIVVAEHSNAVKGKFLEIVGHYNPLTKESVFKKDRILYFLGVGAKPSQSVARLGYKNEIDEFKKYIEERVTKPKKEKSS